VTICPFATWLPVPSHSGPMSEHLGLVIHVQEGMNSLAGFFANTANQVSSTFWVSRAGSIEQYVDTDDAAWTQMAGNFAYCAIEVEGYATAAMTDPQVTACARLFAWFAKLYGIPVQTCDHGGRGLTTHAHYPSGEPDPSWGGHPCPGALRAPQLPAIVARASVLVTGAAPATAPLAASRPVVAALTPQEGPDMPNPLVVVATGPPSGRGGAQVTAGQVFIIWPEGDKTLQPLADAVAWADHWAQRPLPGVKGCAERSCAGLAAIPTKT
jgi:hypothetical protein